MKKEEGVSRVVREHGKKQDKFATLKKVTATWHSIDKKYRLIKM